MIFMYAYSSICCLVFFHSVYSNPFSIDSTNQDLFSSTIDFSSLFDSHLLDPSTSNDAVFGVEDDNLDIWASSDPDLGSSSLTTPIEADMTLPELSSPDDERDLFVPPEFQDKPFTVSSLPELQDTIISGSDPIADYCPLGKRGQGGASCAARPSKEGPLRMPDFSDILQVFGISTEDGDAEYNENPASAGEATSTPESENPCKTPTFQVHLCCSGLAAYSKKLQIFSEFGDCQIGMYTVWTTISNGSQLFGIPPITGSFMGLPLDPWS